MHLNPKSESIRAFGIFELDEAEGELRKRGVRVYVPDQALKILTMLLEKPGSVVTREALRQGLWPGDTYVDFDHSMNTAVNRLRDVLGDSAQNPQFIETLPRRGYRFIGLVRNTVNRDLDKAPESNKVCVAVLPLQNLSNDPSQEYFSEGLTEELITQLGGFNPEKLGVIARTSVAQYKGTIKSVEDIGRELHVDFVIEGSVRRSDGRVRISVQLIRASDQMHLWAESYERAMRDILTLQNEVAAAVVTEIRNRIVPGIGEFRIRSQCVDPEAYESYLKGRHYFSLISREGLRKGIEFFGKAIETEKRFAPAYAGLADCHWKLGQLGLQPPNEAFPKARQAAHQALDLDPQLADAHASIAMVAFLYEWDWAAAENGFRRSIQLNPNLAATHAWYAFYLIAMRRFEDAFTESEKAVALEPLGRIPNGVFATALLFSGKAFLAVEHFEKLVNLYPDFFMAHTALASALIRCSRFDESIEAAQKAAEISGYLGPLTFAGLAYASSRRRGKAAKVLEQLVLESQKTFIPAMSMAILSLRLGHLIQGLQWFEKAFEERDSGLVFLRALPVFGFTRFMPRIGKLVRRMNFPE
jgi:TolB-like protein/Flp pilus assembly protein TadD